MNQKTAAETKPKQETPYKYTKKIGGINYKVSVFFSKTSQENAMEKITRLIRNEAQTVT